MKSFFKACVAVMVLGGVSFSMCFPRSFANSVVVAHPVVNTTNAIVLTDPFSRHLDLQHPVTMDLGLSAKDARIIVQATLLINGHKMERVGRVRLLPQQGHERFYLVDVFAADQHLVQRLRLSASSGQIEPVLLQGAKDWPAPFISLSAQPTRRH